VGVERGSPSRTRVCDKDVDARDLCGYCGDEAGNFAGFGEVGGDRGDAGGWEEDLEGGNGGGASVCFAGSDD
jgi:hypothetical protein